MRRFLVATTLSALFVVVLLPAGPAGADEPGESDESAQPHLGNRDPLPIGETRGTPGMPMATGDETGIDVVTDELVPDRDLSAGDWLGLAGLVALAAVGVWLAARFRPHLHPNEEARP